MENNYSSVQLTKPELALNSIVNATLANTIIIDFDETLLLRNSTAEYLNSLRPRWLGFMLIMLLKVLRPWHWLPQPLNGKRTKDWYLVTVATILLPWTQLFWRKKAKKLARKYSNLQILSAIALNPDAEIIVASLGFNFIIKPILDYLPFEYSKLISCKFWLGASDRHRGKLAMVREILTEPEIESAIVITDSRDDLALLKAVGQPYLCLWSSAEYIEPFQDFWLYRLLQKLKTLNNPAESEFTSQKRSLLEHQTYLE